MRVLITTDLYTIDTNGVVTSTKNLIAELEKKGHEVKVLTFSENKTSHKEDNVYYIKSIPFPVYPNVRMPKSGARDYIKEIIEWKPEVIHSQCEFFSYKFAKKISKKTGAPIVHTYHTLYEQYVTYVFPSKRIGAHLVKVFSRKRLKKAANVIAPTRKVEETLRGYGMKNDISVVPSGIKLEQHKVRITPEQRKEKRTELGFSDDNIVLINLGRLGTEKNLDELMDYFAAASKIHDELRFMIVGDGPAKEGLEHQAKKLGVADKVVFTGMVNPKEVQLYYQLGDIFVSASTSETQGLTYIEAAANGLPLLCRNDKCLDEVLAFGKNGYDYTDLDGFLKDVENILGNPQWCKSAGKRSEEIADSFSTTAFGDAVERIYKDVIKK